LSPLNRKGKLRRRPAREPRPDETLHIEDEEQFALLAPAVDAVEANEGRERAENTHKAYAKEWKTVYLWCIARGQSPMPMAPRALRLYLADVSTHERKATTKSGSEVVLPPRKPSGLIVALAAIRHYHLMYRYPSPADDQEVRLEFDRICRRFGMAATQKSPLMVEHIALIAELLEAERREPPGRTDLERRAARRRAVRDNAMVRLGFAGAFRRGELAALGLSDVVLNPAGLDATLRRSKVDQTGHGFVKAIPAGQRGTCPRAALSAWYEVSGIDDGPIFREVDRFDRLILNPGGVGLTGDAVAEAVKRRVRQIGLDPAKYSGHSLRAGLITEAAEAGRDIYEIMALTGHRNPATVMAYVRSAKRYETSAARGLL
jgi:integrase